MIQSVLFFALGFLAALLLALLALPAIWRRAVRLTRRGIVASMPLSLDEIQASRDQLRAQHAVAARRLEIERDNAAHRSTELTVQASRTKRKIDRLTQDRTSLQERLKTSEVRTHELEAEIQTREELVSRFAGRTKEAEDVLATRIHELSELGNLYEEASLVSTNRQVEVLARETEIERLRQQMAKLRRDRTNVMKKVEMEDVKVRSAGASLEAEKARTQELERKLEALVSEISDKDDRLERRERELERLRAATRSNPDADLNLISLQQDNLRLEAELEALQFQPTAAKPGSDDERLRETMQQLAADVVTMVANLPGQAAPIEAALDLAPSGEAKNNSGGVSLAQRIRQRLTGASQKEPGN